MFWDTQGEMYSRHESIMIYGVKGGYETFESLLLILSILGNSRELVIKLVLTKGFFHLSEEKFYHVGDDMRVIFESSSFFSHFA